MGKKMFWAWNPGWADGKCTKPLPKWEETGNDRSVFGETTPENFNQKSFPFCKIIIGPSDRVSAKQRQSAQNTKN